MPALSLRCSGCHDVLPARFPFNEDVDTTLHVVLVATCDVLVVKNTTKFPDSVPRVISLDIVDDVIACDDFFAFVIDKTFELDTFGLLLEVILSKVDVDKSNDLSSMSCAICLRWHEKGVVNHLVGRKSVR